LIVAKELLTDSGSIFVQIGDENVHRVRCLLDEVFGSENFIATITFKTRSTSTSQYLSILNDSMLWYAKNYVQAKFHRLFEEKSLDKRFSNSELPDGDVKSVISSSDPVSSLPNETQFFSSSSLSSTSGGEASNKSFTFRGKEYKPAISRGWRCSLD